MQTRSASNVRTMKTGVSKVGVARVPSENLASLGAFPASTTKKQFS